MRNFFFKAWEIYRIVGGTAAVVVLVLHFFILPPQQHGSHAAPAHSARASTGEVQPSHPTADSPTGEW
jgi:hypothetical protein